MPKITLELDPMEGLVVAQALNGYMGYVRESVKNIKGVPLVNPELLIKVSKNLITELEAQQKQGGNNNG